MIYLSVAHACVENPSAMMMSAAGSVMTNCGIMLGGLLFCGLYWEQPTTEAIGMAL